MKPTGLLCCLALISFGLSLPTQAQNRGFTVGPVISFDQFTGKHINDSPTEIRYLNSVGYGVDLSYLANRFLFDVRILTSTQNYDYFTNQRAINLNDPLLISRVRVNARYYALPLTVSYRLNRNERLQLFAGIGGIVEWVPDQFKLQGFDGLGRNSAMTFYGNTDTASNLTAGFGAQAKMRYHLNTRFMIQAELALYYFPRVQSPYTSPGNKRSVSSLLTLGYKLSKQ